ncbi:lanthionine synthetase C family protein [Fodinicola acaciae]|uniref:lanthionine synthetase C family protein n=1 Tax=Fodinicola acaciae TaxID=2681555 RepID=UPI001C9E329E|nr:lanthionine synthetase C family protein [Fodinicola acaciae]
MGREEAAAVVTTVASRLSDATAVAAVAGAPDNQLDALPEPMPVWRPDTLGDGHPGIALLFAELAAGDAAYRAVAHRHLTAATGVVRGSRPRLFRGAAALAFAGHAAATAYGGYAEMLERLDRHIAARVVERCRETVTAVRAGQPVGADERYDVISGVAGLGRYLLARGDAALTDVLEGLVAIALAPDVRVDGVSTAAWLSGAGDKACVNLGLAHGVAGPLALLAVSRLAGHRVAGQDEAIAAIVAILRRWRTTDGSGPYWPLWAGVTDHRGWSPPERGRDAWCYGAAGIGRALFLAGAALDRTDWQADGCEAVIGAIATASDETLHDPGLCHGWSGLLQIALRMLADTRDERYELAAGSLAARVLDAYDPGSPFGFRYVQSVAPRPADRPGFLDGAAGVALALHAYATGVPPRTSWDAALLLT